MTEAELTKRSVLRLSFLLRGAAQPSGPMRAQLDFTSPWELSGYKMRQLSGAKRRPSIDPTALNSTVEGAHSLISIMSE